MTLQIPYTWAVGFDELFDRIQTPQSGNTYPPHNVIKHSETSFEIEIAVAGFNKESLSVTLEKSQLIVEGNDTQNHNTKTTPQYLHKGIGSRKFKKSFDLAEHLVIDQVYLENGILSILLQKVVPEELKPKRFEIGTEYSPKTKQCLTE